MTSVDEAPIRTLLIDDEPDDVHLIQAALAKVHPAPRRILMESVRTFESGIERAGRGGLDLLLLDLNLPGSRGLDTLLRIRPEIPNLPIIVLTGLDDESLAVQAIHAGAQDYLIKERITPDLLGRAIRYALQRNTLPRTIEDHLRQSAEERFRKIVDRMDDGVVLLDRDRIVRFANPRALALLGADGADVIGRKFSFEPAPGKVTEVEVVGKERGPVAVEMHTGESEWGGRPALLITLRDMTVHKAIEESLFRMKKSAEETVRTTRERTLRANRELRDSMNAILGFAALLMNRERDRLLPENLEALERILNDGRRILRLIEEKSSTFQVSGSS